MLAGLAERTIAGLLAVMLQAPPVDAQAGFSAFESIAKGWSIERPVAWGLLDDPAGLTALIAPEGAALCGVHSASRPPTSDLNRFTDDLLAATAAELKRKHGIHSQVSRRRTLRLSSGEPAVEVLVDLVPGARSRRLFTLGGNGWAHVVDCETSTDLWPSHQVEFEHVIRSFRLLGR
jgi:hypothetical protein